MCIQMSQALCNEIEMDDIEIDFEEAVLTVVLTKTLANWKGVHFEEAVLTETSADWKGLQRN